MPSPPRARCWIAARIGDRAQRGRHPGELVTLAVGREETWRWTSPLLPVDVAGTGDVLMSLVVSFLLRGESMQQAISRAIAGTHAALEATLDNGFEEFDVIAQRRRRWPKERASAPNAWHERPGPTHAAHGRHHRQCRRLRALASSSSTCSCR